MRPSDQSGLIELTFQKERNTEPHKVVITVTGARKQDHRDHTEAEAGWPADERGGVAPSSSSSMKEGSWH